MVLHLGPLSHVHTLAPWVTARLYIPQERDSKVTLPVSLRCSVFHPSIFEIEPCLIGDRRVDLIFLECTYTLMYLTVDSILDLA